jgi:ribosomal protein L11 methyltransferase
LKKTYLNIHVRIMEENFDVASAIFYDIPYTGVEEKHDEMVITIEENLWNDKWKNYLEEELNIFNDNSQIIKIEKIEDKNWNEDWEKNIESIKIDNDIVITPEWKKNEAEARYKILINPKMSFGTGHHATTRLVGKLMLKYVEPGSFWVDAGTGTGVLAILAEKLGASEVYAFDNNEWSVDNSYENIALNDCNNIKLELADIDEIELPECDGIVANLFLNLVESSLDKFYNSLKSNTSPLIVSGILTYDKDYLIDIASNKGFMLIEYIEEEEWCGFVFRKKD